MAADDGGRSERGGDCRSGAASASGRGPGAGERTVAGPSPPGLGRPGNPPGVEPTGSVLSAGSIDGGHSAGGCSVYDRFDDAFGIGRSRSCIGGSRSGSLGIRGSWTDQLSAASSAGTVSALSSAGSVGGGSAGGRSAAGSVSGRSAASARSGRSRECDGRSAAKEAPGIPVPAPHERGSGGTRASRRAALVRNLVARAMVHNNETRELLEGSPPAVAAVQAAEEGAELAKGAEPADEDAEQPAEAAGEEEAPSRPTDPPRRDPSAGGTGTPWIGLGEDGRDPPEEKDGELRPVPPANAGTAVTALPTSVLCRPRDPLAPASWTGAAVRPRPEAAWRRPGAGGAQISSTLSLGGRQSGGYPDVIDGIGRLAAMERVDGRRAAARDELLRRRGAGGRSFGGYSVGGGHSVTGYSYSAGDHGRNPATNHAYSVGGRSFGGYSVGGQGRNLATADAYSVGGLSVGAHGRNLDAYRTPTLSPGGARLLSSPPLPTSPYRRSLRPAVGAPVPLRLGVPSLVPSSPPRSPARGGLGISETASQLTSPTALLHTRGAEGGAARRREYYRNLLLADGRRPRRSGDEAGARWTRRAE